MITRTWINEGDLPAFIRIEMKGCPFVFDTTDYTFNSMPEADVYKFMEVMHNFEMPRWERERRSYMIKRLPHGIFQIGGREEYKQTGRAFVAQTGKYGYIDYHIELERKLRSGELVDITEKDQEDAK